MLEHQCAWFLFPFGLCIGNGIRGVQHKGASAILVRQPTYVFSYFCLGTLQFQTSSLQASMKGLQLPGVTLRHDWSLIEALYAAIRNKDPQMRPEGGQPRTEWYSYSGIRGYRPPVSSNILEYKNETEGQEREFNLQRCSLIST